MNQSTLSEIIKTELGLIENAPNKYKDFYHHALQSINLLQSFIISVKNEGWFFVAFLSHIKKHQLLSLLSIIRRHHVQTVMNLRQVLESGVSASYVLANPNIDDFAIITPEGLLDVKEELKSRRYKWLEKNYPKGSGAIKAMKKQMQLSSHSNIVDTQRTFKYEEIDGASQLKTSFFDLENEFQEKADLWATANIVMGLMDLFYGINMKQKVLTFSPAFIEELQNLDKESKRLKEIIMNTPNFKRADKIAKKRDKRINY